MKKDTFEKVARVGFVAKGAIYLMIGILAAMWAFNEGGQVSGSEGVVYRVAQMPGGTLLLVLLAIGLASYGVFRAIQTISSPEEVDDAMDGLKRVGRGASALTHFFLAFTCVQALGLASGSGSSKQSYLAQAMSSDAGQYLVMGLGVFVLGAGLYQFYKALNKVRDRLDTGRMSETVETWTVRFGKVGLAARGVVFLIMGWFLVKAGMSANAEQYKGVGGALREVSQQSYGTILLALVALGLAAYGAYMVASARYRRVATS